MKTKFLLFSALAFVILCSKGCTPDEVETAQDQFKPLKIVVTIDDVIQAPLNSYVNNLLTVTGTALMGLQSGVPNNVGLNAVEYTGTAVSNSQVFLQLQYLDRTGITLYPGTENFTFNYDCDEVKVSIYFDNALVYEESKFLGSQDGTCPDGGYWVIQYTL
jgi:hypothetical protein